MSREPRRLRTEEEYEREIRKSIYKWQQETSFMDFYYELKKYVIGQESLKLVAANTYNYLSNVINKLPLNNNMILSASSGSGKTETFRALKTYFAKYIPELDIFIFDMTSITPNGFKGEDASVILQSFLNKRLMHPYGIVFLDEFDKKVTPRHDMSGENINRDVQSSLLTIIEGSDVVTTKGVTTGTINTDRLMFVGLGSFDEYRNQRSDVKRTMGIGSDWSETEVDHYKPLTREDMIEAGASNEIIGRFPYIVNYDRLSGAAIIEVINKITRDVSSEFNLIEIELGNDMVNALIDSANSKFGCRLIKSMLKETLLKAYTDALFNQKDGYGMSMFVNAPGDVTVEWKELNNDSVIDIDIADQDDDYDDNDLSMIWNDRPSQEFV